MDPVPFYLAPQEYDPSIPVADLHEHPENYNEGDLEAIAASLDAHGFYGAVLVQKSTGMIVAGNHRYREAVEKGATTLPGFWLDINDDEARDILADDNHTTKLATFNEEKLLALLLRSKEARGRLPATYNEAELAAMFRRQSSHGPVDPEDERDDEVGPADEEAPESQPGDVWLLGEHRLVVGDCTDADAVARLFGNDLADCMWTDPPYGVSYTGKTKDALTISNDAEADTPRLLAGAFAVATTVLKPGSPVYVAHPPGVISKVFLDAFIAEGWQFHQSLVWVKNTMVLGHSDYHFRHEPLMFGYTPGPGRHGRGGDGWYGDNSQTSVFEIPKPPSSREHPNMKPVALVMRQLANSCPKGGTVYDPFGGSGTTMIAGHRLGQRVLMCELDPVYADVIARRWQKETGEVPRVVRGGRKPLKVTFLEGH